ncbi:ABC transporter substrate-binding protein [Pseudorhodobacter sp.]|uniref:ABC transporter substrate-binding protein n=1 Tax=Pseudorhodobacter sp. TaxID=1934400 RepID=UPI002649775C|nr:extracellular solute-binding protein [Pseudorhodobacter sp.]MDN5788727.1 extracellular solute-binding protein [Pseudorhodobacter sp.]
MKYSMTGALLGAALILAAPVMAQDLDSMTPEQLYEVAKTEGSVTVFSLSSRIAKIETTFEEKYPGIDLIGVDLNSTKQIARLDAEQRAGIYAVDVLYMSEAPIVLRDLLPEGKVTKYVPPRVAKDVAPELQKDVLTHRLSTRALMYNEAAYPDGTPIKNLWQLTTPEWTGKVLMEDPSQRGEALDLLTEIALRSDEMAAAYEAQFGTPITVDSDLNGAGEQFIRNLFGNDLVMVNDSTALRAAVGDIEATNPSVGWTTYSAARDNKKEGWALQISNDTVPSAGILFPAVLAIAKDAPHPAAARLVIDYMMGDDTTSGGPGFEPFFVQGDYAARRTIIDHPDAVPLDKLNLWTMDPAATGAARARILDLIITLQ